MAADAGSLRLDRDEMEFAHQCFLRGHPYLLEHIKRKVNFSSSLPKLLLLCRWRLQVYRHISRAYKLPPGGVGVNGTSGALVFVVTWPLFRGPAVSCASVAVANLLAKNEKTTVLRIFTSVFVEITRKASFTFTATFLTLQSCYYERLKLVITCPSDCRGWHTV